MFADLRGFDIQTISETLCTAKVVPLIFPDWPNLKIK
jgi:hypothetical protein